MSTYLKKLSIYMLRLRSLFWTFQQDNDLKDTVFKAKRLLQYNARYLDWPAQSLDLNLIENL